MKRKKARTPTVSMSEKFERTLVLMCREMGYHRRFKPVEIDYIIHGVTTEDIEGVLEEFVGYVEVEDWDELDALAKQEQTRRMMRVVRGIA